MQHRSRLTYGELKQVEALVASHWKRGHYQEGETDATLATKAAACLKHSVSDSTIRYVRTQTGRLTPHEVTSKLSTINGVLTPSVLTRILNHLTEEGVCVVTKAGRVCSIAGYDAYRQKGRTLAKARKTAPSPAAVGV